LDATRLGNLEFDLIYSTRTFMFLFKFVFD